MMAKVLITGSTGFIGSHLAKALLTENHEVTCLVRRSSRTDQLQPFGVRLAYGDVTDRDSLLSATSGQEMVFHLAGCLRAFQVEDLYRVNEAGAGNAAWACAQQTTPPVLTLVSSMAAVGPSTALRPRTELDPPSPVSNYGRSKRAGELAARAWAGSVPMSIVRPPIVFGERDPATAAIFSPIARFGIHVVPSWRTQRVSLIHADDLVHLLMLAAQRGNRLLPQAKDPAALAQGCYFAASEQDLTYAELGRMIGQALGRRRTRIVRTGRCAVWTIAYLATLLSRLRGRLWYFDLDKAREARAGSWTCSATSATRDLGFAVAAPLSQRFHQTAQWYLDNGWL